MQKSLIVAIKKKGHIQRVVIFEQPLSIPFFFISFFFVKPHSSITFITNLSTISIFLIVLIEFGVVIIFYIQKTGDTNLDLRAIYIYPTSQVSCQTKILCSAGKDLNYDP